MKVALAPSPLLAAVAALVGAAAGVALSFASRPADADARMAKVRDTMAQVARVNSQRGTPGNLPLGAVCSGDPAAADGYKALMAAAAARRKLPAGDVRVQPPRQASGDELTALSVVWKGVGEYTAFVAVLSDLAAEKPALFVEALDIKPRGSRAEFELKGKIWCWTPAANRSW